MTQPQAILFDVDGVVIVPHPSFSAIFPNEFGVDPELVTPFFKKDFPACLVGQADLKEKITPWLSE